MSQTAILFDCDGVLVDSETIYVEVEREHLSRIGLEYDLHEYQQRFNGLMARDFFKLVQDEHAKLETGSFPVSFFTDLETATTARINRDLEAIDGIGSVLASLTMPRAVASSSRLERLHIKLRQTGLHGYFDPHIYSGEQVANGKPAPDLFLYAATQIGAEPRDCIVIEDSVNGVLAGKAAGMEVWGFIGGGHASERLGERLTEAGASKILRSHEELGAELG
ncbi:HAD family hydrolase [Roseibium litorale]|uniref:HAD family hydrolase n=1 Tax=Roseibium litorale TaxID=2803841 RepID=A0ABR9CMP6_9HYPH|nr:HAD family hydrolase [Roseibium litorale]MBD8892110.1 HAD family hydrolase [Roseibium litorale]